jgi:hypothetical protein
MGYAMYAGELCKALPTHTFCLAAVVFAEQTSNWSFIGGAADSNGSSTTPGATAGALSPTVRTQSSVSWLQQDSSNGGHGPLPLHRGSSSINSRSSPALLAVAAAAADGSGSDWPGWITASLGQQWQQETPFPEVGHMMSKSKSALHRAGSDQGTGCTCAGAERLLSGICADLRPRCVVCGVRKQLPLWRGRAADAMQKAASQLAL